MYLPLTPVIADIWRATIGRAARAAALDKEESMVAVFGGRLHC